MSYDGLAQRMAENGCPIPPSAIFKTENVDKDGNRRRIVVDELVAYARVFGVAVEDLVAMPGERGAIEAESALREAYKWRAKAQADAHDAERLAENARVWQGYCDAAVDNLMAALGQLTADEAASVLTEAGGEWGDELRARYLASVGKSRPKRSGR